MKEKGFLKEHYSNKNFCTFIRLIFCSNFFWNSGFFWKNAYLKERFKKKFKRTKFERKKWILKERYSIKQPPPSTLLISSTDKTTLTIRCTQISKCIMLDEQLFWYHQPWIKKQMVNTSTNCSSLRLSTLKPWFLCFLVYCWS